MLKNDTLLKSNHFKKQSIIFNLKISPVKKTSK